MNRITAYCGKISSLFHQSNELKNLIGANSKPPHGIRLEKYIDLISSKEIGAMYSNSRFSVYKMKLSKQAKRIQESSVFWHENFLVLKEIAGEEIMKEEERHEKMYKVKMPCSF